MERMRKLTSECLFMKYTREIVDNSFGEYPKHKAYGALLKKCTCDSCMKEKNEHSKKIN